MRRVTKRGEHVDAIGEGVTEFARGERVAMLSSHSFAEYDFARVSDLVRLPSSLEKQPFPAEPSVAP